MKQAILTIVIFVGCATLACDIPVTPYEGGRVSFRTHIAPRIYRDCCRCHFKVHNKITLMGTVDDYPSVMDYVDTQDPEAEYGLLWYASGGGGHPVVWHRESVPYQLFLTWVEQGAEKN